MEKYYFRAVDEGQGVQFYNITDRATVEEQRRLTVFERTIPYPGRNIAVTVFFGNEWTDHDLMYVTTTLALGIVIKSLDKAA